MNFKETIWLINTYMHCAGGNRIMSQKTREKKKRILASALCVMMLLFSLSAYAMTARASSLPFTLTPNTNGYGSVSLDWRQYNYSNKNFKVYKSSDGGRTYETVGIDYKSVREVKVLQVYPDVGANQLQNWLVNTGYGQGIIKVGQVSISDFNRNPSGYLYETSTGWSYDVVFFGTWDRNNCRDLSAASYNVVNKFAKAGKGVIFGHDVALNNGRNDIYEFTGGAVKERQNYFDALATTYLPIIYYQSGQETGYSQVAITKKGLFTTYPNYIGEIGTVLNIPYCHSWGQRIKAGYESNMWLNYTQNSWGSNGVAYGGGNFYLISYNNLAMIQTGHSSGAATSDEQKILANLVFYMNQLLFNTYTTNDASAQDVAKPNTPNVSQNNSKMSYSAEDNGSTYWYYVESFSKDDTTASGLIDRSEKKSLTVTTGVKKYRYLFSNNATETLTTSKGTETTDKSVPVNYGYKYFHVAALDGAGNISATKSVEVKRQFNLNFNYNKPSNASHDITGNEIASKKVTYKEKYGDLPNPKLEGWKFKGWYTSATGGTQVSKDTIYEATVDSTVYAHWEQIKYTVRFNGNGNWNTSQGSYTQQFTYDVSGTLTPNKFTRPDNTTYNSINYIKGYEFIGWGTSATQKTATYTDKQEVKNLKNTQGAVLDLYAIWKKPITLTFNFNGGKFNDSTTNQVLNYTMYNSELSHTFDIKTYYGTLSGSDYNSKGLNTVLTKTDTTNGIQYRFLGYSLDPNATVPDANFDVYAKDTRIENYTIKDNTTLYAVWEPVLQMTVQLSVPSNPGTIVLTDDVAVNTALGNFKILSGTKNTDLLSSGTASVNSATIGVNVTNEDLVSYTVSAKGASSIKFSTAADSRILDIYNHGKNNPWFDNLNEVKDFNYSIDEFSSTIGSFTIPQYLGTTQSYQTSNPDLASGTAVYGIKFTCTQPSYYYKKYWNSDESTSIYCILFLQATDSSGSTGGSTGGNTGGINLPPYAVEDGMYNFQTILN